MNKTKILLVGFGNIGRSILKIISNYPDLEIVGIVTRRKSSIEDELKEFLCPFKIYDLKDFEGYANCGADVAIMCGGSKDDLPKQTPFFAKLFNVVDSFDTHRHIGRYFDEETKQPMLGHLETTNNVCLNSDHTACIGVGWDPGAFSLMRAFFKASLGNSDVHSFYGITDDGGLSMGHSNALKEIPGVIDARQYTHAKREVISLAKSGKKVKISNKEKHWRECKVVISEEFKEEDIKRKIIEMPEYFKDYETTVEFVCQEKLDLEKDNFRHNGLVVSSNSAGSMEFSNFWNSNPVGTAGFMLAYARAVKRLNDKGEFGCLTVLDIPVKYLLENIEEATSLI
ncbi:MAG: diaminopimelate dehydrogenase [Patescibacteria group bacterium]